METKTLQERGIPEDSYFTVYFEDGSFACEKDMNWSDIAETIVCDYFGGKKMVCVSHKKITKIIMKHADLLHEMSVPHDCLVYQAVRSETMFYPDKEKKDVVFGRVIGLVKNNQVLEEFFLDGRSNEVVGMRI